MTTATPIAYRTVRVPVTTPLVKAILAVTFAQTVSAEAETLRNDDGLNELWCGTQVWAKPGDTDSLIDQYRERAEDLQRADGLLRSLRDLTPGKDAFIDIPGRYGPIEQLDNTIQSLKETDADDLIGCVCTQRQVAEATIEAIDLQETIADLQDAIAEGEA